MESFIVSSNISDNRNNYISGEVETSNLREGTDCDAGTKDQQQPLQSGLGRKTDADFKMSSEEKQKSIDDTSDIDVFRGNENESISESKDDILHKTHIAENDLLDNKQITDDGHDEENYTPEYCSWSDEERFLGAVEGGENNPEQLQVPIHNRASGIDPIYVNDGFEAEENAMPENVTREFSSTDSDVVRDLAYSPQTCVGRDERMKNQLDVHHVDPDTHTHQTVEQPTAIDRGLDDEPEKLGYLAEDQILEKDAEINRKNMKTIDVIGTQKQNSEYESEFESGTNASQKVKNERNIPTARDAISHTQPNELSRDSVEGKFFSAIENSDISVFMDMLSHKEELNLDISYQDATGQTALRLAISQGYSGIVEQLLIHGVHVGDAMLRAVEVGLVETVEEICRYAAELPKSADRRVILNCHCENDEYHPNITPMVLAAHQNDFAIVKILKDAGCKIEEYGSKTKNHVTDTTTDDLQKSVGSLEVYKGLASEAYLTQANDDPVETAFQLSSKLRALGQKDVEFKISYMELAESVDQIGTEVISYARDTEEILTILAYHKDNSNGIKKETLGPLPKLQRAISYEQKQFVAHPNCQQAILAKFYGRLAFLRDRSTGERFGFFLMMILGFPFFSLLYLYVPTNWVKNYVGCPYIRFLLKLASDIFFVALLTADTVLSQGRNTELSLERPTNVLLLVWIIGITWREVKNIRRQKMKAFTQMSHWRDIFLVILFLLGTCLDVTSYYSRVNITNEITSRSLKDTYSMSVSADGRNNQQLGTTTDKEFRPDLSNNGSLYKPAILHRFRRQARRPSGGTSGASQSKNYTITDFEYLSYNWWNPRLIATGMFAISTVISFLRLLPYLVVSDAVGPLQISIVSMVTKTANFFVLVAIVFIAFAVGLTYIYAYYDEIRSRTCNEDIGEVCIHGKFANLFYVIVYLYWSALGLEDQNPLKLNNQAQVLESAGLILYAMFYVSLVIVLLNALIAVMSEVYSEVEENGDVEWKFHSTAMWISVLLDDDVVPPPFNLLPSAESIRDFIPKHLQYKWKRRNNNYPTVTSGVTVNRDNQRKPDDNSQYKRIMNRLVERYVMAKTADELSVEANISSQDILGLRNDLVSLKLEMFQKLLDSKKHIDNTSLESSVTRNTSFAAKSVLTKVEQVYEHVDKSYVQTIITFQADVVKLKDKLLAKNKEFDELLSRQQETEMALQHLQNSSLPPPPKTPTMEASTQTPLQPLMLGSKMQTRELDFWARLPDDSDENQPTQLPASTANRSGIATQLTGGLETVKSRIGEGYQSLRNRAGAESNVEQGPSLDAGSTTGNSDNEKSGVQSGQSSYFSPTKETPQKSQGILAQIKDGYETAKTQIEKGYDQARGLILSPNYEDTDITSSSSSEEMTEAEIWEEMEEREWAFET